MVVSNRVRFLVWIILVGGGVAASLYLDRLFGWSCPRIPCIIAGIILLGIILRAAAVTGRYLAVYGKSSSGKGFGEVDRLVTVGPYSCMRHPMHFYLSLLPIAIGLIIGSPTYTLIIGPAETILILVMAVTIDERESIERFGEQYIEYKKKVKAFNLNPKCLAKALAKRPPKQQASSRM